MKLSIMQPYLFPYIGYFQLINSTDQFIVYDNIKYTKKGWINRNRYLQNGSDAIFSLPIKQDSDYLDIRDRQIADSFNRDKLLNQIKGAYHRAPYFSQTFSLVEKVLRFEDTNLFNFLYNSIVETCEYIGIVTDIRISSSIPIDHSLKGEEKVIALCAAADANIYINASGGKELYSKAAFSSAGIDLKFIEPKPYVYQQYQNEFVPWLSIIDVMMFNSLDVIRTSILTNYELN